MTQILGKIRGDKVIWAVVILLSVFSLLAVYSSTGTLAYKDQGGNTEYYMFKHLLLLLFGLMFMYLTHLIKFTYFSRIFQIALYIAVPLLAITLFWGLNLNEAKRVLALPFGLTFQTSDLAKLTLIMYLARLLSIKQDRIKDFKSAFVPLMIPVIIVCALILPANFSTAAMLFTTSLVIMFIGRVSLKYIFSLIGIGIVGFALLMVLAHAYPEMLPRATTWKARIENFANSENNDADKNYQVDQAKIAIASGGLFGKFPGNSTQRNFLPHPYSDFIFAIFVEEYGLIGGSFLVLLYLILFFRVVRIVTKIPRNFGAFLTVGVGFSLVFQAMINMAVAVNLIPVTGQPLPLMSMGGTSIWFTSISLGIILSVSKEIDTQPENIEEYAAA
ncbi:MAG: FtsW/RodA/SpoVE family cell cycle protein [Bacteroidales bacterium]|nr:FtsW/RodA/SpoVE family cell cycle protein [Bacteroidales bacterium]